MRSDARDILPPHAPDKPGYHDDACTMLALGAAHGKIGDLLWA